MLDKDKLIIVAYLGLKRNTVEDYGMICERARINLEQSFDESVISLVVPTNEESTRIECLTPKIVDEKLADEFMTELKKLEEIIKKFTEDGRK